MPTDTETNSPNRVAGETGTVGPIAEKFAKAARENSAAIEGMERAVSDLMAVRDLLRVARRIPKAAAMLRAWRMSAAEFAGYLTAAADLAKDLKARGAWIGGGGQVIEPDETDKTPTK